MRFRYAKVSPGAKDIIRAHATDAGMDFFAPTDMDPIKLLPGESCKIDSGIKVEVPFGYMGIFCNKSGVASKKSIIYGAHVVDSYYSGNVIINLHNIGNEAQEILPGDKILQMVIVPIAPAVPECVDESLLYEGLYIEEYRKEKGFGATGDK